MGLQQRLNDLDDKVVTRKPWRGTKAEALGLMTGGAAIAFGASERTGAAVVALAVSLAAFAFELLQRRRQERA